jgi:hypothetical protein
VRSYAVSKRKRPREKGLQMTTSADIWTYREQGFTTTDLTGYSVEALDGGIGKIDEASYDVGSGYVVIDTGPWIFGKKVMLPAGVITNVDHEEKRVWANRTKDQIKHSPEFDADRYQSDAYRGELGSYYGTGGAGWHD